MRCGKAILGVMLGTAMVLGTAARPAAADTIHASFFGATWEVVGSSVRMFYKLDFANTNSQMDPGLAFFTIYNFEGFVPGSMAFTPGPDGTTSVADWVPSPASQAGTQTIGIDAIGTAPANNPLLPNLTWDYVGLSSGTIASSTVLGYFSAVTTVLTSAHKNLHFTAQDTNTTTTPLPSPRGVIEGLRVPDSTSPTPTVIPLPLAVWGGLALFGMVGVMKARRRHS